MKTALRLVAPSALSKRLDTFIAIADQIQDGLSGKPFHWGDGERRAYVEKAAAMGVTLVTITGMLKQGYVLKTGATPVGRAYFAAPLSRTADLYVLECQCKPKEKKKRPSSAPEGHCCATGLLFPKGRPE